MYRQCSMRLSPVLFAGSLLPAAEVAVSYPDTANKLNDDVLRRRLASLLFERVHALRPRDTAMVVATGIGDPHDGHPKTNR
jgi:hypothetical protein